MNYRNLISSTLILYLMTSTILAIPNVGDTKAFWVDHYGFQKETVLISSTLKDRTDLADIWYENTRINDIAISGSNPDLILLATESGVSVSYDGGNTWSAKNGDTTADMLPKDYWTGRGTPGNQHRVQVDAAYFMADADWMVGASEGYVDFGMVGWGSNMNHGPQRSRTSGDAWGPYTRGCPVYTHEDNWNTVDERPTFYEMTSGFSNANDFWSATQAGLLLFNNKWYTWPSTGLPTLLRPWDHLDVYDLHYDSTSTTMTAATALGVYQGNVDFDRQFISWVPLNTEGYISATYDSVSDTNLTVSFTPTIEARTGDWFTLFNEQGDNYWSAQCSIIGGTGYLVIDNLNLYASLDSIDTLDYQNFAGTDFTLTPAENHNYQNLVAFDQGFYVADDKHVYSLINGQIDATVFELQEGVIHDLRMHNGALYIATDQGVYLNGSIITPTLAMLNRPETYQLDIRSLASNGTDLYVGGHLGGFLKSTDHGNTWMFLNTDLDHREIPAGGRANVVDQFDPTNSVNIPETIGTWFGNVHDYIPNETLNVLIYDIGDEYYSSSGYGLLSRSGDFKLHELPSTTPDPTSNSALILYLDNNPLDLPGDQLRAAASHWMTYLTHNIIHPEEAEWVKQGLAFFSDKLVSPSDIQTHVFHRYSSLSDLGNPINFSENAKVFWTFIWEKYLSDPAAFQSLINTETTGIASIMVALEAAEHTNTTFPEVFKQFGLTTMLDSWSDLDGNPVMPEYSLTSIDIMADFSTLDWGMIYGDSPYSFEIAPLSFHSFRTKSYDDDGIHLAPGLGDKLIFITNSKDSLSVGLVKSINNGGGYKSEFTSVEEPTELSWPGNFYFDVSDFEQEGFPDTNAINILSSLVVNSQEDKSASIIIHDEYTEDVWLDLWPRETNLLELRLKNYVNSEFQLVWSPINWDESIASKPLSIENKQKLAKKITPDSSSLLRDMGFEGYKVRIYSSGELMEEYFPLTESRLNLNLDMDSAYCFDVRAVFNGMESNAIPVRDEYCQDLTIYKNYSRLWTTITNNGIYGEPDAPASPSMEWPGGSNVHYLWEGRLWVGGVTDNEIRVSHAQFGVDNNEWMPNSGPAGMIAIHQSDTLITLNWNDYYEPIHSTALLGFEVQQETRSFSVAEHDELSNCLKIDLTLTKSIIENPKTINDVFLSWVFDADVGIVADPTSPHIDDLVDYEGFDGKDSDSDQEDIVENLDWNGNGYLDGYDELGIPYGWEYVGSSITPNPNYNPDLVVADGYPDEFQVVEMATNTYIQIDRNMSYMYDADDYSTLGDDTGEYGNVPGFIGLRYLGGTIGTVFAHQWWNWDTDPQTDIEKYQFMSASHEASNGFQFIPNPLAIGADPFDYRWLMSIGPLEQVNPGDQFKFSAAVVLGKGIEGLRTNSDAMFLFERDLTAIGDDPGESMSPQTFYLSNLYPNPFNSTVTIPFSLTNIENTTLTIFDITGRVVEEFTESDYNFRVGENVIRWQGLSNNGKTTESGIYLIQLRSDKQVMTKKAVLIR